MAEEPRRSGRATKGVNTKERDIADEATPKRGKGKGKGSKAKPVEEEQEEEDEIIRCVCGLYEEEEEVERAMICCDNCSAWQHNDCMGLPADGTYEPVSYFCEECKPENHKDLLAAIARGETPWVEIARLREAAAELKSAKKKGGKRGRKSAARQSDVSVRASPSVEGSQTPSREIASGGQKRKLEEPTNGGEAKNKKARSSTSQADTPTESKNTARAPSMTHKASATSTPSRQASRSEVQGGTVADLSGLGHPYRKGVAQNLIKLFIDLTNDAVKQGAYILPPSMSAKDVGTGLGLRIEHALYYIQSNGTGEPNEQYKEQMRTIFFNAKKNLALRDRLLSGDLSDHEIAAMDPKEMASEEQQRKDAAMKKEMERQHTIIAEQGPRIRKTHKGEEYVDEELQVARDSVSANMPVRRETLMDVEIDSTRSPDSMGPKEKISRRAQPDPLISQARSKPSLDLRRRSSASFNINDVWSSVQQSPDSQQFPQLPHQSPTAIVHEPSGPGTKADADIDELLKDEDAESPPYSPKDYADGEEVVWRGIVNGGQLGRFHASARYAAGCDVGALHLTYRELIPAEITIGGRIDPTKADEYLCSLQYSTTNDLTVVAIRAPEQSPDLEQFNRLFTYFKSRKRYGVGTPHPSISAIKDIYLMPLEVGEQLPELLKLLDNEKIGIENPISERIILIPFVVKNTELSQSQTARDPAPVLASPMSAHPSTAIHSGGLPDFNGNVGVYDGIGSPANPFNQPHYPPGSLPHHAGGISNGALQQPAYPSPGAVGAVPAAAAAGVGPPPVPQRQYDPNSTAALTAAEVFGPDFLTRHPSLKLLITQVPNAGKREMRVIREIVDINPLAGQDLQVLTYHLTQRQAE